MFVLAGILAGAGGVLQWINRMIALHLESIGCVVLPRFSQIVITTHRWPFLFGAGALVCAILGATGRLDNRRMIHAAFWISLVSVLGLLAAVVGYTIPNVPIITPLK